MTLHQMLSKYSYVLRARYIPDCNEPEGLHICSVLRAYFTVEYCAKVLALVSVELSVKIGAHRYLLQVGLFLRQQTVLKINVCL